MFRTIVVGTDGSAPAMAAVDAASEIARRHDVGEVHVVAGYRPMSPSEMLHLTDELPEEFAESLTSDAPGISLVDDAVHVLRSHGVRAVGHAVAASGADAILDVAERVGADLVVVGSRGHGLGRRLLRGSVSTKVSHHAPCSVMIVHDDHHDHVEHDRHHEAAPV